MKKTLLMTALFIGNQAAATTITVKEIKNEANTTIDVTFANGKKVKIDRNETFAYPEVIATEERTFFDTLPITFSEGSMPLFNLQFRREQTQNKYGGTMTNLKTLQNGKVIGTKEMQYPYNKDSYDIKVRIIPGKKQVVAQPFVTVDGHFESLDVEDWVMIENS